MLDENRSVFEIIFRSQDSGFSDSGELPPANRCPPTATRTDLSAVAAADKELTERADSSMEDDVFEEGDQGRARIIGMDTCHFSVLSPNASGNVGMEEKMKFSHRDLLSIYFTFSSELT